MTIRSKRTQAVLAAVSLIVIPWVMIDAIQSGDALQAALTGIWFGLVISSVLVDVMNWRRGP